MRGELFDVIVVKDHWLKVQKEANTMTNGAKRNGATISQNGKRPAVSLCKKVDASLTQYVAVFLIGWITLMSKISSVPLGICAAYFPPNTSQVGRLILWISALGCFVITSYRLWARERKRVNELLENNKPKDNEDG
jgi:hypothetical protein